MSVIKIKLEIIWTGGLHHLGGIPHLPWVPSSRPSVHRLKTRMALSLEMIRLGRVMLCLLLLTQLVFFCSSSILFSILSSHWIPARILLSLVYLMSNLLMCASFFIPWLIEKRHLYSYSWFVYTGMLIFNTNFFLPMSKRVVHTEQDNLFGPKVLVKVLCIAPFILLLFLNTAGEGGTEFHGESGWLFATMSAQIFDAIDMIDNVLNGYGNGTPTGLGVGMIILAFGCLLLAAWEFLELAHHSPGSKNGAKVHRLIVLILVSLATLIIRAVVYVDYGWRETTPIAKNVIMICISVSELRRCFGQTSL